MPPKTTSTQPGKIAQYTELEMIPARHSPNVPAINTIAAGNDASTVRTQEKSFSADVS